ncbi:hypothetical protein BVG19_g3545 [[Candida] boidinii]|nr:hypothetical protein BVG19_g3545 [[Candida] boidinii]OWB48940.1 hypothetical protein B5S27_g478 [[Candida] boidinii]
MDSVVTNLLSTIDSYSNSNSKTNSNTNSNSNSSNKKTKNKSSTSSLIPDFFGTSSSSSTSSPSKNSKNSNNKNAKSSSIISNSGSGSGSTNPSSALKNTKNATTTTSTATGTSTTTTTTSNYLGSSLSYDSYTSQLTDKFLERLISMALPPASSEEGAYENILDRIEFQKSRPQLSVPVMSRNVIQLNQRLSIPFELIDEIIKISSWSNKFYTVSVLLSITLIILKPVVLITFPFFYLTFGIMAPAYLKRHPPEKVSFLPNNPILAEGPPLKSIEYPKPVPELSREFILNLTDLQNHTLLYVAAYDFLNKIIVNFFYFKDDSISSFLFLSMMSMGTFMTIVINRFFLFLLPLIKLILIIIIWLIALASYPSYREIVLGYIYSEETRIRLLTITNNFESKLHKELKLVEYQEIREIEIYELQILDPDTRNWKLVCYTNEIFSPNSHIRLNNLPIDGSLSLNNIKSPKGWKYIDKESLRQKEKSKSIKRDKKLMKKKRHRKLIQKANAVNSQHGSNININNNDDNDSTYNDSRHENDNDHEHGNFNDDDDDEENDGDDDSYEDDDDDQDEDSYDDDEDDDDDTDDGNDDDEDDDVDYNDEDDVDDEITEFEVPRIDESAIEDDSMNNTTSQSIHTVTQSNDDNHKTHDHSFLGGPSFHSSANNTFNSETSSIHSVHSIHNAIKPFSNLINTPSTGSGGNGTFSTGMNSSNNKQNNNTLIDHTIASATSTNNNRLTSKNNTPAGKTRTYSSNSMLSANTLTPVHYPKAHDGWALDLTPGEWVSRNCLDDLLEIDEDEKWCYDSIVAYDVQSGSIGLANNKGKRQRGDFRRRRWIRTCVRSYQTTVDPTAATNTPHTSTHTVKIPASSSYHNMAKLLNHQTFNASTANTATHPQSASTVSATKTTATVAPQTDIPSAASEAAANPKTDNKKNGFYSTLNSLNQKFEHYTNSALKSTSSNDSSNASNKKLESDQSESELDHYL